MQKITNDYSNESKIENKKIYKQKLSYTFILMFILLLGFVLRVWNLNYIQGSDLFNLSSGKAFYDNGHFFYERNLQLTYLIAFMFKLFGPTLFAARLALAVIGTISIFLMYLLGTFINKKVGIICAFLLSISPVAIEESTMIREYSENFFISLLAFIFIFTLIKKNRSNKFLIISLSSISILLYLYSHLVNNYTILLTILAIIFAAIPCLVINNHNKKKRFKYYLIAFFVFWLILFAFLVQYFLPGFHLLGFDLYWFHSFFLPTIQFPMQWFSLFPIPEFFLILLFLVPIFIIKNRFLSVSYFTFICMLAVFIFKYQNTLSYVPTRYSFIIYPFYILIFSTVIYILTKTINKFYILRIFIALLLINLFINPSNIKHAANHDLVTNWPYNDSARPTSTGTRKDALDFMNLIKEKKLINSSEPIILNNFDPAWLLLQFDINIDGNRFFSDKGSFKYDIGKNVFLDNDYWQVYDLESTVKNFKKGVYITRTSTNFPLDAKFHLANFKLVIADNGFEIYSWSSL
ncbi:MAG: glycosyltransferase family 39 protein [Candidatus Falkowbacteria bacterium]